METVNQTLIHATAVSVRGYGLLLTGSAGSGKSDLAFRLIDRGAMLVSDDQTCLYLQEGILRAKAPETILGMIEVRGVGVLDYPVVRDVELSLHVALKPEAEMPRLPEPERFEILGISIPSLTLSAFEISAAIKVELALKCLANECTGVATFLK